MGCILYTIIQALPLNGFHLLFFSPLCSRSALLLFCADPQRRFRLQSLQAIGPEASAKGGAWNLAWAWRMVKKNHWIGSRENGHLQEIIVFPY